MSTDNESRGAVYPPDVLSDAADNFPSPGACCFCGGPITFKGFGTKGHKIISHSGSCGCGRWSWDAAEPAVVTPAGHTTAYRKAIGCAPPAEPEGIL